MDLLEPQRPPPPPRAFDAEEFADVDDDDEEEDLDDEKDVVPGERMPCVSRTMRASRKSDLETRGKIPIDMTWSLRASRLYNSNKEFIVSGALVLDFLVC